MPHAPTRQFPGEHIDALKQVYGLGLTAEDSHRLHEAPGARIPVRPKR
jgi:hypothetical protein